MSNYVSNFLNFGSVEIVCLDQPAVNRLHFVCTNLSLLRKAKKPSSDLVPYIFCFLFTSSEVGKVVDSITLRHQVVKIYVCIKRMLFFCVTGTNAIFWERIHVYTNNTAGDNCRFI